MMASGWTNKARGRHLVFLLWLLIVPLTGRPEQLPLKSYTTADGLARDQVERIVKDSRGYLWFCTPEGLSRFDGYTFTNYTMAQGLPDRHVNDLLETRGGVYWVATDGGVCRFNPAGTPMFVTYRPSDNRSTWAVNVLVEDHNGAIYCGTALGLYRLEAADDSVRFAAVEIGLPARQSDATLIAALLEDRDGALWIGTGDGLYQRAADGGVQHYTTAQGLPNNFVQALLQDSDGRLWLGTRFGGLCQIEPATDGRGLAIARAASVKDGLASNWITSLLESSDRRLWVGTNAGFSELITATPTGAWQFRNYSTAQGLSDREVWSLAEDGDGSLWLGTANGGAMRLARGGFITYGVADGLDDDFVTSIFEDRLGKLCVTTSPHGKERPLNQFDGRRFIATKPRPSTSPSIVWGWGWNQIVLQDREGDWWLATSQGVYRYAGADSVEQLGRIRPKAIYTTREGLGGDNVFRLFEDSRGDLWISTFSNGNFLTRWERATSSFHRYTLAEGITDVPTTFREDAAGNLWIGFYAGGLVRYRSGQFTRFTEADGVPAGMIRALYLDVRGRLWVGSGQGGLNRIDDPAAAQPRFIGYTIGDGLSSNDVWCITEDQWGQIYAGTGRGLDRLDPQSGHLIHYTAADGLAHGRVEVAYRDHRGALWFGTAHGLSRLRAEPERPGAPPPIVISSLRVAGVAQRVSELGETRLSPLTLEPAQNDIEINFVGLSFGAAHALRYQYKLEGADAEWSPLTDQRTVNYANLSPGSYRFVVQAVSADGSVSATPATFTFTIRRPFWQRWWFILLAGVGVGLVIYATHRYRLARLIELERVRTRIATDLHDDIGSSLSRMAILSEVVKRQVGGTVKESLPILSEMADSSRGLLDSMSDIVWSIDPRRDELSDLALRIRQFAADVLEAKQIRWDLQIPQEFNRIHLSPDQRRQLFLIFKEAINNIARHAGCNAAWLQVIVARHQLAAEIRDDGEGFALSGDAPALSTYGGHGLENMRQRAAQLGGRFEIESAPGKGTILRLTVPLKRG